MQSWKRRSRTRGPGQCAASARDGCRAEGQLRPPGHADGHGGDRRGVVAPPPAPQPGQPRWVDRDRFVLSNGHGSMLLYALLHLTGYDLPMEELKRFRQLHSRTPGTRRRMSPGAETTTGPLGRAFPTRSAWRIARSCSPGIQPPGLRDRLPLHLRVSGRRLSDGGNLARSLLAGRNARSGQAHCVLRRQWHLDRRARRGLVYRRHAEALRGVRLARRSRMSTATTARRSTARFAQPRRPSTDRR